MVVVGYYRLSEGEKGAEEGRGPLLVLDLLTHWRISLSASAFFKFRCFVFCCTHTYSCRYIGSVSLLKKIAEVARKLREWNKELTYCGSP